MALLPGIRSNDKLGRGHQPGGSRNMGSGDRAARFKVGRILKYTMLPGIVPRIRALGARFGMVAYMLAMIFYSAGLLPKGHPMLNGRNVGRYGVVDVISTAANNIVLSKSNIDKVLIFIAIVISLIMVVIQAALIGLYVVVGGGVAQASSGTSVSGMFTTANPNNDIVFSFLQQLMGVEGFFNEKAPVGFSIADGVHAMLGFYSTGLLVIAVMIVLYYVVTVVGEAAKTGQPFGGRFNSLWAPVRLVIALGLLVPFGSGLNAAQYVVLYTAKAGSSFATNAWGTFADTLKDPKRVTIPPEPLGVSILAKNVFLMEVCMAAYNKSGVVDSERVKIVAYLPQDATLASSIESQLNGLPAAIKDHLVVATAKDASQKNVKLSWQSNKPGAGGSVEPKLQCGSFKLPYLGASGREAADKLADASFKAYLKAIGTVVSLSRPQAEKYADFYVQNPDATSADSTYGQVSVLSGVSSDFLLNAIQQANQQLRTSLMETGSAGGANSYAVAVLKEVLGSEDMAAGGWGNAGSFYMRLAFANQRVQSLTQESLPVFEDKETMNALGATDVCAQKFAWWFCVDFESGAFGERLEHVKNAVSSASTITTNIADSTSSSDLPYFHDQWEADNPILAGLKMVFMISSLQAVADNPEVFPMVHLINIGNDLIIKAFAALAVAGVSGFLMPAIGNFFLLIALLGLGIGFLLSIVLPFMPFIYFFFAIVEWGMGVLEGMVGAPLWALAHIRIDGDGMPGPAAMQGYYILLGILLKPFLIVFALLASYMVFNAGAYFLNNVFGSVVGFMPSNDLIDLDGGMGITPLADIDTVVNGSMGIIRFIGYLIVYTIITYNLGLVSFKMIDQIPAQAMRWMGQGDPNYKDGVGDPIGRVNNAAIVAGSVLLSRFGGGVFKKRDPKNNENDDGGGGASISSPNK